MDRLVKFAWYGDFQNFANIKTTFQSFQLAKSSMFVFFFFIILFISLTQGLIELFLAQIKRKTPYLKFKPNKEVKLDYFITIYLRWNTKITI